MLPGSLVAAAGDSDSEQQRRQLSGCSEESDLVRRSYSFLLREQISNHVNLDLELGLEAIKTNCPGRSHYSDGEENEGNTKLFQECSNFQF